MNITEELTRIDDYFDYITPERLLADLMDCGLRYYVPHIDAAFVQQDDEST